MGKEPICEKKKTDPTANQVLAPHGGQASLELSNELHCPGQPFPHGLMDEHLRLCHLGAVQALQDAGPVTALGAQRESFSPHMRNPRCQGPADLGDEGHGSRGHRN